MAAGGGAGAVAGPCDQAGDGGAARGTGVPAAVEQPVVGWAGRGHRGLRGRRDEPGSAPPAPVYGVGSMCGVASAGGGAGAGFGAGSSKPGAKASGEDGSAAAAGVDAPCGSAGGVLGSAPGNGRPGVSAGGCPRGGYPVGGCPWSSGGAYGS